jgi:hypothetical protein
LTKTLLPQKHPVLNREFEATKRGLVLMKRKTLALTLILALLFSVAIGGRLVKLGISNPWYEDRWTDPPVISIQSPTNETCSDIVLLNFTVTKPDKWKSKPTVYLGTPTRYGDVQQFDFVKIELDGKLHRSIEVYSNLSSPFSYSENLTNLGDGVHSLRIYAYGTGIVEGCEWSPNTSVGINSSSNLVYFRLDTISPIISVLSVENKTYYSSDVLLDFTVNELTSQITFSLDGQENVTISGNTTLTGLPNGDHNVTVYATDKAGNVGASEIITFTIAKEPETEPFPTTLVATAAGVSAAIIGIGLLFYFKKRRH